MSGNETHEAAELWGAIEEGNRASLEAIVRATSSEQRRKNVG